MAPAPWRHAGEPASRAVAASLAWATERCLYVASFEADRDLRDEQAVVEPLVTMWLGAVFGAANE